MKRVYELDVYKLTGYKAIVDKLGPKLNAFINDTHAAQALAPRESMKAKFLISNFNVP